MKSYGVLKKNIFQNLYVSNEKIYKKGLTIYRRPKIFLFVGQLIKEKGIEELLNAFKIFSTKNKDWKLVIVGNGPLKKLIPKQQNIQYYSFKKPEEVAKLMKKSRFLVLPTYSDHWPLVVNEATLCGCGLIITDIVGNRPELSNKKNSLLCKIASTSTLLQSLQEASVMSDRKLDIMFRESVKLGLKFTTSNWVNTYYKIINNL